MTKNGAVWSIRGRKNVRVWKDAWIPRIKQDKLSGHDGSNMKWDLRVEDLI